jgi:hypothetical protein
MSLPRRIRRALSELRDAAQTFREVKEFLQGVLGEPEGSPDRELPRPTDPSRRPPPIPVEVISFGERPPKSFQVCTRSCVGNGHETCGARCMRPAGHRFGCFCELHNR